MQEQGFKDRWLTHASAFSFPRVTNHKRKKGNLGKIDEFSLKSISPPNIITFVHMLLIDILKKNLGMIESAFV